jgi:L-ribulose-5-phosphate 3-epimerase
LGSHCVSLWSGSLSDYVSHNEAMERLFHGLQEVLEYAAGQEVVVALEPEPGMLIDTTDRYENIISQFKMSQLQLTLDIGHLHCQGETPIAKTISRFSHQLVNVHIDDMKTGVHKHLMFGEGEIDFPSVLKSLTESGYNGGLFVELNRHSHEAPQAAKKAFDFLNKIQTSSGN